MRVMCVGKAALVAGAVVLLSSYAGVATAAPKIKLPPGACAFEKRAVASGTICSYECNPENQWCSQQWCQNGQWTRVINCYGPFCSNKCGG